MADNVTANPGAGGATFASDEIGGVQYPRSKVVWGPDGTATDTDTGSNALPVQDGGNSLTVDGSITANAGTNLNTSALALEAGGNLAGAATSLAVIDDWDETDRAKVNPIAGQAGVQGGSGTANALTQRVVLATDVALPTGSNTIGAVTNTVLSVVGGGTEATAQRVTIASDSTGVLSVDDNGGSLTVDGTVDLVETASIDYDTGGGTVNQMVMGIALPGSGGPVAGGTVTNPLSVTGTVATETQDGAGNPLDSSTSAPVGTERGLIVRNIPSGTQQVSDGGGSLTVDGTVTATQGGAPWTVTGTYTEDNASAGGESLILAGAVRQDGNTFPTSADGDYATLTVDSSGRLKINNAESVLMRQQLEEINLNTAQLVDSVSGGVALPSWNSSNPIPAALVASPIGGSGTFELVSDATTNATVVKPNPGRLNGFLLYNTNAAARYVKFYDTNTTPTAGTKPKLAILVPGGSAGAGNNIATDLGIQFNAGIAFVTVTGTADSDTTAVGLNDLIVNLLYL